jgi:hypothetical protein
MIKFNIHSTNIIKYNNGQEMIVSSIISILNISEFENEKFTNREALCWLIQNSEAMMISCSIRKMAEYWKWHKSRVEKFLKLLKAKSVINTQITKGKLQIEILLSQAECKDNYWDSKLQSYQQLQQKTKTVLETFAHTISTKGSEKTVLTDRSEDKSKDILFLTQLGLSAEPKTFSKTILETASSAQEEKKKSNKKRKESIKEKNIPFGDTKKENGEDNFLNSDVQVLQPKDSKLLSKNQTPIHLVETKDVEDWAKTTLPFNLDLTWELGKFQDYWNTARKKPPQDGVAAFRNWLRKAVEIKTNNNGDKYDRFNNNRKKTSDFERFLIGGAGALDELRRDRLDGNSSWQE